MKTFNLTPIISLISVAVFSLQAQNSNEILPYDDFVELLKEYDSHRVEGHPLMHERVAEFSPALQWQSSESYVGLEEVKGYCSETDWDGYEGWRLPTYKDVYKHQGKPTSGRYWIMTFSGIKIVDLDETIYKLNKPDAESEALIKCIRVEKEE